MATFYISATGNAANSGATPGQPKTVAHLNNLNPGDTAILLNGNYNFRVNVENVNGTASNRITIKGESPTGVVINGGWNGVAPPCSSSGVVLIGEYDAMLSVVNCDYLDIEDININGSTGEAMEMTLCNHCNVRRIKTDISWGAGCITQGSQSGGTTTNINFYDCVFNRPTVAYKWHHDTVCGQEVDFIQSCFGFFWNASNCRAERCIVSDGGAEQLVAGRSSSNITFFRCISYNGRHNAAYLATSRNCKMQYCLFYNTSALASSSEGRQNGLVFRDEKGALDAGATTSQDNLVEYCIFVNLLNGITWGGNSTMTRHTVRNCTFVNCERPLISRATASDYAAASGCVYENNILYNSAVPGSNTLSLTSGITFRNNLVFGSTFTANAQGSNFLTSNPNLVNPNTTVVAPLDPNNFKIGSASSPAIGSGFNNATTTDFFLGTFTAPIDRGAHHYSASPPDPDPDPDPVDPGTPPVLVCNSNILQNHNFANGLTNWTVNTDGVSEIVNGELHVTGTTGFAGTKQVYQFNVPLTAGQQYRAQFTARTSSVPTSVSLQAMLHTTPFTNNGLDFGASLNTQYQAYSVVFTPSITDVNNRLRITWTAGELWLDDFCLEPLTSPTIDASFVLSATTLDQGGTLTLEDTSTSTNTISGISINWGDSTTTNNLENDRFYDHLYSTPGTYTVTMTVTSAAGSDTYSQTITVVGDITASFTKDLEEVISGQIVTFTNTSVSSSPITKYLWDFGDGSFSTQANPKHSYVDGGTYNVTLTVTSADGTDISEVQTVNVVEFTPGPNAIYELLLCDPSMMKMIHLKPSPNPGFVLKQVGVTYEWAIDKT